MNHTKGSIVMPVLIIVAVFAVLLTSGKMINISNVDLSQKFENPQTSSEGDKQNLQLKKVTFDLKPTPAEDSCNHDMSKQADPDTCECTALFIRCESNLCVEINQQNSGAGFEDWTCERVNQSNWCQIFGNDGDGWYCIGKPVIYLYPEFPMLVDISIKTAGKVIVSDPQIEKDSSWKKVMAHPNGILFYDNQPYRELFYETETQEIKPPENGLVIKSTELEVKLLEFITRLGLTRSDEQKEFMQWWLPRLESYNTSYWMVSVLEKEEKQRLDKVMIEPQPDTFIQFIVYFKPIEKYEEINLLQLPPTPERIGFTAVEWGGVIDSN